MRRIWSVIVVRKMLGLAMGMVMLAGSAGAALAGPDGVWELESRDTRLQLALCGDGTQLCGALVWLSDADYNTQYQPYLNAPVTNGLKADGSNRWKGAMKLFGQNITGTITQQSETQMTLQACAFLVVCKTYGMFRYAP